MFHNQNRIKILLDEGVKEGVYPGAVLLVAQKGEIVFFQEAGHLSLVPEPTPMRKDTIFDLASFTKPLATAMALMRLIDRGKIGLDQPLSEQITPSSLKGKEALTPRLLLNHSAGLEDWKPFYMDLVKYDIIDRKKVLREWIVENSLAYSPGKDSIYSDLGFMILEWLVEAVAEMSLRRFLEKSFYDPLGLERLFLGTGSRQGRFRKELFAATEFCPWRDELIQGRVHDENAYALGGYSGHAGLFGDAESVFILMNMLREHFQGKRKDYFDPDTVRAFFTKQDIVDGSTWALGWDTPSPGVSSAGKYFSVNSVGHLGFTGTSMWMDLEQDIMVIFLTNRIHTTRDNLKIKAFRPRLHDVIMEELRR